MGQHMHNVARSAIWSRCHKGTDHGTHFGTRWGQVFLPQVRCRRPARPNRLVWGPFGGDDQLRQNEAPQSDLIRGAHMALSGVGCKMGVCRTYASLSAALPRSTT